ncbi:hypothetical protein DVJ77_04035 [Dyella tabacisoli]|uniref:Uncharacterized protein n=1 Tax=Dyella tabacisoli TaxID=2282381 RepID=A0A369UTJ0_9GAMM|nr:hypothetical protein DVJ77_04035 [Dyella tabacisoli]
MGHFSLVGGGITLLCVIAGVFACGGLSATCRWSSHSLLSGQEKVTNGEGHPGESPFGYVRVGRAFRQGFLPWRKGIDIHVDAPAGLVVRPSPTHRGPKSRDQVQGQRQRQKLASAGFLPCVQGRIEEGCG